MLMWVASHCHAAEPADCAFQLVCRRAKFHFSEEINDYSSTTASDDMVAHLDYFRSRFSPVNTNLRYRMYYV